MGNDSRYAAALLALVVACGGTSTVRRALVTDSVHAGEARADVVAWHDAHGWCRGDASADADEFIGCQVALLDRGSPPIETWVHYVDGGARRIELFVPVPCRVSGPCDRRGMQRRLLDALAAELEVRYGPAVQDSDRTAFVWRTDDELVGVALARGGGWVTEVHFFSPPRR